VILLSLFCGRQAELADRLKMNWLIKKLQEFTGTQRFLSAQLDITSACNLKCRHCYLPNNSAADLSMGEWNKILDQYSLLLNKLYLKPHFSLSGGEPTLSPLFVPMLEELHSRWPDATMNVLSNGTTIPEAAISAIVKHKADVQISMDGPDAERHDAIRGPGSFEKAVRGYRELQSRGVKVALQAVLSHNTAPWADEFFEMAAALKAPAMNFTRFVPQGRGKALLESKGDRPLNGYELRDAYVKILSAAERTGVFTGTGLPLFVLIKPELGAHGKAGFQGIVIDSQGWLKVTSRADFRLGNVVKDGLEKLFLDHPLMQDLRAGRIEGCGACLHYDKCGGDRNASFSEYGSFLKKDPCCWI